MAKDAMAVSNKWKTRLQGSTEEMRAGVMAVTVAPGLAAAQQKQAWLARINASADKWARNVAAVSLQDWQGKMTGVGISRVSAGAEANQDKVTKFMQDFLPHVARGQQIVKAMPNAPLEDGIQRMIAMARHNATFKRNA